MSLKLYTYEEMADLFQVKVDTIRKWQTRREFKIFGYRRLGKWAKEALVTEEEIKRLMYRKYSLEGILSRHH